MKYLDFYNTFKNRLLIDVREVRSLFPDFDSRRFYEWQKKGYIKKLSNLFYIFTDADKMIRESEYYFISNKLVEPSYVSMESALRTYNLIPEVVFLTTCITTRKTKMIETPIGNFQYRSIKENLFFGYNLVDFRLAYKMAEPEKAILDFLYLRSDIQNENDIAELRLNEEVYHEIIDQEKIKRYLKEFDSNTLNKKIKKLNKVLKI